MKIKRPELSEFSKIYVKTARDQIDAVLGEPVVVDKKMFNQWFDKEIAPYEFYKPEDAIEVFGFDPVTSKGKFNWIDENNSSFDITHRALLINIEPIKKDSAEDVLKDVIAEVNRGWSIVETDPIHNILERAKRVLGEK